MHTNNCVIGTLVYREQKIKTDLVIDTNVDSQNHTCINTGTFLFYCTYIFAKTYVDYSHSLSPNHNHIAALPISNATDTSVYIVNLI